MKRIRKLVTKVKNNPVGFSLYLAGILLILYNIALASLHLITQDFSLNVDISRDFLLIDNAIKAQKIELIGPKAGGIPGMFFGPIWYWMLTPLFIMGNGDPMLIGAFWVFLVILLLGITYFIANRIFGKEVAFISAVILSFQLPSLSLGFTQSFGSLLMSPFIFYFLYLFYTKKSLKFFVTAIFLMGVTFHLQPAFTMLIIAASGLFFLYFLFKIKKLHYLFSYLILLIPLSTFIVFDLRHKFLMSNAFLNFLFKHTESVTKDENLTTTAIISNRILGFLSGLNFMHFYSLSVMVFFALASLFIIFMLYRKKVKIAKEFYVMFYSIYIIFWILSFLFKGFVWEFYYWGFLPISAMLFASIWNLVNKKVFIIIVILLCFFALNKVWIPIDSWSNPESIHDPYKDPSSWKLNKDAAEKVFNDAGSDFGFFVFSPDEFGYPIKYAMRYKQYRTLDKTAHHCKKHEITYLFYYPDDESSIADSDYWKKVKIRLEKDPIESQEIGKIKIEKYLLTSDEINESTDPNLLCELVFR